MVNYDQAALVAAATRGASLPEIAKASHISVTTVQRRLQEPEIRALIRAARERRLEGALSRVRTLQDAALDRLAELVNNEDCGIALKAINLILTTQAKFEAQHDVSERLGALEQQVSGDVADLQAKP